MRRSFWRGVCRALTIVVLGPAPVAAGAGSIVVATTPGGDGFDLVERWGVVEVTIGREVDYGGQANEKEVVASATFTSPEGESTPVVGFYWGQTATGEGLWKVRFRPRVAGEWSIAWSWQHTPTATSDGGTLSLRVVDGGRSGPLAIDPLDPTAWITDDGAPFYPIGLNDCIGPNDRWLIDGGDRFGAFGAVGVPGEVYLSAYAESGFNMFRLSQENCSYALTDPSLASLDFDALAAMDELVIALHRQGFHLFFGIFGYFLRDHPGVSLAAAERFARYAVDRWGALVDVWQIANETVLADAWIDSLAAEIRARDPYDRPISTSWERPDLASIEVNSPHNYTDPSIGSDEDPVIDRQLWGGFAKPMLFGERGNFTFDWLPSSDAGTLLRFASGALEGVAYNLWNTAYATNGVCCGTANSWIGPGLRAATQALDRVLGAGLDRPWVPLAVAADHPWLRVRGRGGDDRALVLVNNWIDPTTPVVGATLTLSLPTAGLASWIDLADGSPRGGVAVTAGSNALAIPPVSTPLMLVARASAWPSSAPTAVVRVTNPQEDGDLDDDGAPDYAPPNLPFGVAPLELSLDASASRDPDGGPVTVAWDFGDGTTGSGASISHTWSRGLYVAIATVTDDEGESARAFLFVRATGDPHPDVEDPPLFAPLPAERRIAVGGLLIVSPAGAERELVGGATVAEEATIELVSGLPPGATFGVSGSAWTPQLWWRPGRGQTGTWPVTFLARDGAGLASPPRTITLVVGDPAIAVFADDFESGATARWWSTVP